MTGKQVYHVLSMVLLVFVSAVFLRAEQDKGHEAEMRQPGREAETEMLAAWWLIISGLNCLNIESRAGLLISL